MNRFAIILCASLFGTIHLAAQDIDQELSVLADKLGGQVKEKGKKKVTVLDFTDLQGNTTELGRYIAEQLTVNLVGAAKDFTVLDRANLKSILAEHKLTSKGLIDPENAKKLGMFAGVDTLILGTITPKGQKFGLTAKVITTDTAEIVGAARAEFKNDDLVKELVMKPTSDARDTATPEEKARLLKTFDKIQIHLQSLKVVKGSELMLTLMLTNTSASSIWAAIGFSHGVNSTLIDYNGAEYNPDIDNIIGLAVSTREREGFFGPTELRPKESQIVTMKYYSRTGKTPFKGAYSLQCEFLVGNEYDGSFGPCRAHNLVTKLEMQ